MNQCHKHRDASNGSCFWFGLTGTCELVLWGFRGSLELSDFVDLTLSSHLALLQTCRDRSGRRWVYVRRHSCQKKKDLQRPFSTPVRWTTYMGNAILCSCFENKRQRRWVIRCLLSALCKYIHLIKRSLRPAVKPFSHLSSDPPVS